MAAEYPALSFRLKRMRFSSRIVPFVLHTNEKESLLASVVNVLFLRRKIQLPKEITTLTFDDICRLITPVCKREDPELIRSTLGRMTTGCGTKFPLDSLAVVFDDDVAKLLKMLSIDVMHGCLAGNRYKAIKRHNFEDLAHYLGIYALKGPLEGMYFKETEAAVTKTFLKKYQSRVTEKGLQLLKEKFQPNDNVIHAMYHRDRFSALIFKDDTLYVLMAAAVYETHGCIWEMVASTGFVDQAFKPYHLDPSEIVNSDGTPRLPDNDEVNEVDAPSESTKVPMVPLVQPQGNVLKQPQPQGKSKLSVQHEESTNGKPTTTPTINGIDAPTAHPSAAVVAEPGCKSSPSTSSSSKSGEDGTTSQRKGKCLEWLKCLFRCKRTRE
ncbi:hypothetical protein X943_002515 [Babesia divergens]|uniref:MINDY deubiquitinase domain-containing protein n=1 Tax=Babesia divergens TaxID=32595 RepID=A0AAD9GJQ9_BABDI|nr:hypothetical protein X943_002515 [Babesia divergens]